MNCKTCIYWRRVTIPSNDPLNDMRECRRRAPVATDLDLHVSGRNWAVTHADDWCGEWTSHQDAISRRLDLWEQFMKSPISSLVADGIKTPEELSLLGTFADRTSAVDFKAAWDAYRSQRSDRADDAGPTLNHAQFKRALTLYLRAWSYDDLQTRNASWMQHFLGDAVATRIYNAARACDTARLWSWADLNEAVEESEIGMTSFEDWSRLRSRLRKQQAQDDQGTE